MAASHPAHVDALRALDTCSVSNAIETFGVRLRNEGYIAGGIQSRVQAARPMIGHAVTAKMRCSSPPLKAHSYQDRTEWWDYVLSIPEPRVVVIQDVDEVAPGSGSFVGEVHAHIMRALGCEGIITDGAVRDLDRIGRMASRHGGFHVFSRTVAVSHAYAHLVEVGGPVRVGGLEVGSGMLLHGDRHGVVHVPADIAARIPEVAARMRTEERRIIELCESPGFTPESLRRVLAESHAAEDAPPPRDGA
jgi:regulator of RNase E activity RraA